MFHFENQGINMIKLEKFEKQMLGTDLSYILSFREGINLYSKVIFATISRAFRVNFELLIAFSKICSRYDRSEKHQ